MERALIIMIKNPVKGKVKTRLAAESGDEKALTIYKELLHHTMEITQHIDAIKFIFYSDLVERNDIFDNSLYKKYVQCSGDLGTRMEYAFSIPFKDEFKYVVMIGSDCIDISPEIIQTAFDNLREFDFVIGPATDGGYYLIGMKKWNRTVFQNKSWSTEKLFEETQNEILSNNGKIFLLPKLSDIDTIDDVKRHSILSAML